MRAKMRSSREDEHGHTVAISNLTTMENRTLRVGHILEGLPVKAVAALISPQWAKSIMRWLKRTELIYQSFESYVGGPAGCSDDCRTKITRSCIRKTTVTQLVAAARDYAWTLGPDLEVMLDEKAA